jgi:dTDP-4-amino-4,6-dideoxygalactose transaminase
MDTIPLNRPDIRPREHEALEAALSAHARCERGPVTQLEETAARVAGRPHAVAAASSGIAIEAAMLTVGLRLGDEVVCPAYGPARLVAGISRAGGRPRFVDAQPRTGGYDTSRMEAAINDRTRAIIVAPTWFDPATLETIAAISRKYEIPLIEDAVESLGSTIGDDSAGRFGVMSVIGLGHESPAYAAGGGVVLLNDERLANTCREILLEGRASANNDLGDLARGGWGHHRTGVDGRLDPLRAAVAIGVLERLEETIELRRQVADRYVARLGGESQLQIPAPAPNARPSWPAFPVRLDERFVLEDRDAIIAGLRRHEILAAAGWSFGPDLPIVAGPGCAEDQWPIAARLAARTIHLPCHPFMTEREVDLVCQTLLLVMKQSVFTRDG